MYSDFQDQLRSRLAAINDAGLYNERGTLMSGAAVIDTPQGQVLNFKSSVYIDNQVDAAKTENIAAKYGDNLASVLEGKIARLLGTESCLLFNSLTDDYVAISAQLLNRSDAIIYDTPSLYSLTTAVSRASKYKFHNTDLADLEKQLKLSQAQQNRLIVVDAVNIASGNIAPLNQIFALADRYRAMVAVDETNAAGLFVDGGGASELLDVKGRAELTIGSLTKAFGCQSGAYIAGRREIIDYLRQPTGLPDFAAPMAKTDIAAAISAIDNLPQNTAQRQYLLQITNYLIRKLYGEGFEIPPTQSAILAVMVGDNQKAELFARHLHRNNLLVTCLASPLIDNHNARIVLQLSANHTQEQIEQTAKIFGKVAREIDILQ